MPCTLKFPDSNVAKALRKITGSNDRLYASYLGRTVKGGELTKDFVDWYQARHPRAKEVSTDASEGVSRNIAKGIVEYYNYFVPDGRTTIRRQSDAKSVFYSSVADRNLGKRIVAGIMLRISNQYTNIEHGKALPKSREEYENKATQALRDNIIKWVTAKTGFSRKNVVDEFNRLVKDETQGKSTAYQYILSLTQGMELSIQEENQLAMLREMLIYNKEYFNEVFKDSRLSNLVIQKPKDDTSDDEKAAMNAAVAEETVDDDSVEDYFDESFRVFDSHDGIFKTFEMHVGSNIRNYFNQLRKLKSTAKHQETRRVKVKENGKVVIKEVPIDVYDEDTNNAIGLTDTMNASQCVAVMYSSASYASVDSMIESVRRIANTQPGMEAFIKFADDLAANRDFACEVYRTFAKNVIAKTEIVLEGNEMKVRISNTTANKLDALRMEYVNTSRYNAISVDGDAVTTIVNNISRRVSEVKNKIYTDNQELERNTDIIDICKSLADVLRLYYPTIDDSTIINYVYGKQGINGINEFNNIISLGNILRQTVKNSKEVLKEYRTRQYETAKAKRENEAAIEASLNDPTGKRPQLKDIAAIWAEDYFKIEQQSAALALATELVNYSVVKIELNSRNVEGNLSSDVINSSFITNFINTLGSELNVSKGNNTPLAKFGNWKLGGHQYNLSNILVEERDSHNNIINYGLFRKTGDNVYVPTSYAQELISISLFNGASDINQGKNVLYSKMSTGDYIATAMSAFFNDKRNKSNKVKAFNGTFASYFMRTPSDAPKNFLVSAPRYLTTDPFNDKSSLIKKDGTFNRNHVVFHQYRRLIRQELTNAVHALEYMIEVNNGVVRLDDREFLDEERTKRNPDYGKPILSENIKNLKDAKHNLYKQYHYIGEILEPVKNDNGIITYWRLTGNVFKSSKLTYVDDNGVVHNFMDELINEGKNSNGTINFLYGGLLGNPLTLDIDGNVIISPELQDKIDNCIESFISALVEDGVNRISKFEDLLENIPHERKDIQDFMINYHLMYNNFDDLFEGDAKFYGTAQDFLKRAKEVQASGVPYANEETESFGDIYDGVKHQIDYKHSALENNDFADIRSKLHDMHLFDKFTGVTIKNTVKQDPMTMPDGPLAKELVKAGLSKERANEMMKGYAKTTVNDAQSYITLEEWIRRIALRGQLYQYKPLIEALLDESKPLTVSEIQQFIQVQKNFYYDHYKDPRTGIIVPRQIKNAEFVLVPRFIKGTELEQVYNAMIEAGIDQLNTEETSKAGKARVLTLWDENGVLDKKAIDNFKTNAKVDKELFDYKHLYTQQETPQHVAAENKAGLQVVKKILDNIDENSSRNLRALKENFIKAFCANIQDSYEELCAEIGIELDEDGNIQLNDDGTIKGLDYSKLSEKFIDELNRLGSNSQMYDFVEINPDKKVPVMPAYLNSIYYKLQNISQSIFNNGITRQKLPGFHAAQITQVGFRPFSEKVNRRQYDSALQYHPQLFEDAEGNEIPEREYVKLSAEEKKKYKKGRVAPYIEIKLPKANFGLSHLSDEEALAQLKAAGVDEIIGYRIPTEGKQSVCVMKVVGFTDDALGSTIVVPDGWVAQTGSDFDIDSVYGIHWEVYFDRKGNLHKVENTTSDREHYNNYIINKLREVDSASVDYIREQTDKEEGDKITPEEVHELYEHNIDRAASKNNLPTFEEFVKTKLRRRKRAARNNVILQAMIGILQDPSMLEENLSRSNSDDLEDALDDVLPQTVKNRRLGRSPYNFLDQADYQNDAMSGVALKGFSVIRDTMCSISNSVKPTLDDNDALYIRYLDGRPVKHNRFGWSQKGEYGNKGSNKNIDGRLITVYSSETTAFNFDAVKKGAIPNVNDLTFSTFKTFVDLGSNYNLAVAFMVQPAITRIVEAYHKGNSIYSQDSKKPVDEAIMSIARDLGYKEEKITPKKAFDFINGNKEFIAKVNKYLGRENQALTGRPDDIEHTFIDEAKLISRINETGEFTPPVGRIGEDQLAFDLATILTYNKISKLANQLTNVAMILNPDKFGAKQTIYATRKVFDDIADIILNDRCPLKVIKDGKKISMVEAIYPGVVVGTGDGARQASLDHFLKTKGKSAYPSLYTFLKYATAPSIKVNQTLFKTQSDYFVERIKEIQGVFSGKSTKISEDLYDDVERYYLGYVYNQLETLRCPTDYLLDKGFRNKAVDGRRKDGTQKPDEEIAKETATLENEERARIFGFNRSADLVVEAVDEAGETYLKEFTVKDINKPTQDELFDFAKLSPAQKLAWVQKSFRDSVICEYFTADLSNRKNTYNTQTIRYAENNIDIETVFQDFADTFNNENPLLAMTAMDLIKYAFVAEGFRMSKGAVNKTVSNVVLYNPLGMEGSGIISQLMSKMEHMEDTFDSDTVNELIGRYVRTHMNMKEISHSFISKKDSKAFKYLSNGVYYVEDADMIVLKNIGYREYNSSTGREDVKFNKYITLNRYNVNTLYEIVPVGETCFLIPLNKLEANETTEWSSNVNNNKFPKREFYLRFIEEQVGLGFDAGRFITSISQQIKDRPEVSFQKPKQVNSVDRTDEGFDINDPETYKRLTKFPAAIGGPGQALDKIKTYFSTGTVKTFYFKNAGLEDIIKKDGTIQVINNNTYRIYKTKYKPEGETWAGDYIAVEPMNKPTSDNLGTSVEEQIGKNTYDLMREARQVGTPEAVTAARQVENGGIRPNVDGVKQNMGTLMSIHAQYLTNKVDKLLNGENGVNTFTRTEDGRIIPMNDSHVGEMIRTNANLRRQFIKNILDARALINKYKELREFGVSSTDISLKASLDKIIEAVKLLENSEVLKDVEEIYCNEYLSKVTKNPLIKKGIIGILDGYHSTSAIEALVHDLQETGNPLIQVISKDVMADVRGREMKAQRDVSIFRKKWADIEAKAKANGRTIDLNKIIDDNGEFIKPYVAKLKEDFNKLRDAIEEAKNNPEQGIGSIEHLKAKLAYDKFVLQNFNQELPDDFYAQRIALEEEMITKFPAIYSKYKKLSYELSEILSHTIDGELDPAYEARRVAVNREIQNLRNNVIVHQDGTFTAKGEVTNPNATPDQIANSATSANALDKFIKSRKELYDSYYEYTDEFGFDELLERYQDVITEKEADAATGRIDLRTDENYRRAKEWINKNTRLVYDFGTDLSKKAISKAEAEGIINDELNPNLALKAFAAIKWLYDGEFNERKQSKRTSILAKRYDARDNAGIVDARKFSLDELASIKKEQEGRIKGRRQGVLDENAIISSTPETDTIYKKDFWEKISAHGLLNQDYLKVINGYDINNPDGTKEHVNGINDILRNAYDKRTGVLRTSLLTEDEMREVLSLMEKIGYKNSEFNSKDKNRIKRTKGVTREQAKATQKFIKEYCEPNPNMTAFRAEENAARNEGQAYYREWCKLNYEWVEGDDGFFKKVPNRLIWGGLKLKDNVPEDIKKKYIDVTRTNAIRAIKQVYDTKPTEYYYEAWKEAKAKGEDYFNTWYDTNHIYNPYTHSFEPIECWIQRTPNDNFPGHLEASFNAQVRNPIETNKDYRPDVGHLANYKTKTQREKIRNASLNEDDDIPFEGRTLYIPDGSYDNPITLNPEEKELMDYMQDTLIALSHNNKKANDYFKRGGMAIRSTGPEHDTMFWVKDFLKHFGIVEGHSGKDVFNEQLGEYENDYIPDMPMAHMIRSKEGENEIGKYKLKEPNKNDAKYADNPAKYEEDLKAYNAEQEEIKKIREREHKKYLDKDWKSVMEDFILKAAHYNAIQDNKYALYMGMELLKKIGIYQTKYSSTGQLKVDQLRSNEDQGEVNYITKPDKHLIEQYQNWIRRLIFDQFKKQQGAKTNVMSRLQAFTSTNYMTLNIRGGIANVTLGETTIFGETLARDFIGKKDWLKGKAIWARGVPSFILGMNKDTSTTLADAIVKAFNVVDYDEIKGNPYKLDLAGWNEKLRDLAFSPQTAGEHFMQNGMLFSMMLSHRLVPNKDSKGPAYIIMSESQYMADAAEDALESVMTDDQKVKYQKYIDKIKSDANITRNYAWWRRDVVTDFVNAFLTRDEQRAFAEKVEANQKEAKAKFETYSDVFSQMELKDGKMSFKAGSELDKMDTIEKGQDISDAWAALGEFKSKVISVNKYIHGVYDKIGAAMMEREWYGAIVMQYHKHIPMGIARFYRRQGYFNEERANVNKGIFASIKDFLTMNVRAVKTRAMLSDAEVENVESLQELFKTSLDFIIHAKLCYDILPEYEKANLRRSLGYLAGMMSAVCFAIALRCMYDDDDPSLIYNLGLYEADRLASEAWQFTPPGAYIEAKKLFSQPIAAQSIISDVINAMGLTANYIIYGEDADLYFQSGRFAHKNKIGVYVERRIPIWRNIKSITDIAENNHYYKLGDNMLSLIPVKDIAKWIKE